MEQLDGLNCVCLEFRMSYECVDRITEASNIEYIYFFFSVLIGYLISLIAIYSKQK